MHGNVPYYRASRQVIGRDCSQKILSPSIYIVVGNFCEQSLPITCRDAQYKEEPETYVELDLIRKILVRPKPINRQP